MKTKIMLFGFLMIVSVIPLMGQYAIPSYNIEVSQKATFQEQRNMVLINPLSIGKREVNIQGQTPTFPSGSPCAEVWVYSLDRHDISGPYNLLNDEILQVLIDDREWGVYIEVSAELSTDVWINGGEL